MTAIKAVVIGFSGFMALVSLKAAVAALGPEQYVGQVEGKID